MASKRGRRAGGDAGGEIDRRGFLGASAGVAAGAAVLGCGRSSEAPGRKPEPAEEAAPPSDPKLVRVGSVKTAVEGGVLPALIARFEAAVAGVYRVELATGERVYDQARAGALDLVISHFGHRDAEAFVLDGCGEWPRTIFSNQMALVGPASDPAGVRGLDDAVAAYRAIAATRSPFVVNAIDGVRYLTEILWHAAGKPDRAGWVLDDNTAKEVALARASKAGAYTLWGLTPFLRFASQTPLALEPLVLADPLLQRMLVSVIVRPGGPRAVNAAGANALQAFLLAPATQAQIRSIPYTGAARVSWVPGGRHNRSAVLPKG